MTNGYPRRHAVRLAIASAAAAASVAALAPGFTAAAAAAGPTGPTAASTTSTASTTAASTTSTASTTGASAAGPTGPTGAANVIVRATPGDLEQARLAVTAAGGAIGVDLSIIDGFAATMPAAAESSLEHAPGIDSVTPDFATEPLGSSYFPYTDAGSPVGLSYDEGFVSYWTSHHTGQGVGVALIDSGVAPVPALAASGKVFYGPDFTPSGYFDQLRGIDGFGHGTFMAGLIAGRDPAARAPYINSAAFTGVAPDAHIVSVKVGDENGTTTESAVIAGIEWATQHRGDPGLNIKVMNLSLGVRDNLPYTRDPLDAAVEAAWRAGITVVAAAGNDGRVGLLAPANDPYVIAVGAVDTGDTLSVADDKVASFSDVGDGSRNPDIAALGTHIVSLRDPGSFIDDTYGDGPGSINAQLMRGSGTSESAAITSGAVALLLSQRPGLTPDQVKATLKAYAMPLPNLTSRNAGAGALNMSWVYAMPTVDAPQHWRPASSQLIPDAGITGSASTTPQGSVWRGALWTSAAWTRHSWTGPTWHSAAWSSSAWSSSAWSSSAWSSALWSSAAWSSSLWSSAAWSSSLWSSSTWTSSTWTSSTWTAARWQTEGWS